MDWEQKERDRFEIISLCKEAELSGKPIVWLVDGDEMRKAISELQDDGLVVIQRSNKTSFAGKWVEILGFTEKGSRIYLQREA